MSSVCRQSELLQFFVLHPSRQQTRGIVTNIANTSLIINKRSSSIEGDMMKSALALAITLGAAVIESANADTSSLSLTSNDGPSFSSTTVYSATVISGSTSYIVSGAGNTTSSLSSSPSSSSGTESTSYSAPTVSTTPFANATTTATATQTVGGITSSPTISGSLTETASASATSSPTSNAAGSHLTIGVAVMAGILGVLAAL
ncbi:hypothetical protein F5B19DRAFT_497127 [Rostrohypoxylon terebratum]|nr:hypothetical protein F5B19DRAFT_497127 [Rostrohypoxylon terebratum]